MLCCATLAIGAARAADDAIDIKPLPLSDDCYSTRSAGAKVDRIVLHFCSLVTEQPDDPFNPEANRENFKKNKVSTHYMIDRDGTIYNMVDEKDQAWHVGNGVLPFDKSTSDTLNNTSIGIELLAVGSEKDMVPLFMTKEQYDSFKAAHPGFIGFTDQQYDALNKLLPKLEKDHPDIKHDRAHIVAHSEYATGTRTDPGELFDWTRIGLKKYAPLQREREYRDVNMNSYNIFWRNMRFEQIWKRLVEVEPTSRTVVMLGDSITEGFSENDIEGFSIINQGINSDSIDHPTLPIGIIRRLDLIKLAHPEHVFFLIGINDICDNETPDELEPQFIETYDALIKELPNTKIHITPIFPVAKKYAFRNPTVNEVNERIIKLATERGFDIMDLRDKLTDKDGNLKEEFTSDGVHVNNNAYKIWTAAVAEKLREAKEAEAR